MRLTAIYSLFFNPYYVLILQLRDSNDIVYSVISFVAVVAVGNNLYNITNGFVLHVGHALFFIFQKTVNKINDI